MFPEPQRAVTPGQAVVFMTVILFSAAVLFYKYELAEERKIDSDFVKNELIIVTPCTLGFLFQKSAQTASRISKIGLPVICYFYNLIIKIIFYVPDNFE